MRRRWIRKAIAKIKNHIRINEARSDFGGSIWVISGSSVIICDSSAVSPLSVGGEGMLWVSVGSFSLDEGFSPSSEIFSGSGIFESENFNMKCQLVHD